MRWVLVIGVLAASLGVARADVLDATQEALRLLNSARGQLEQVRGKQDRIRAYGKAIQAYQVAVLATRAGMVELTEASQVASVAYEEKRQRFERVLGGLQSIGRAPHELTLLHPDGPLGAARAQMIMAEVLPQIRAEAETLRRELEELETFAALQETAIEDLQAAKDEVAQARATVVVALQDQRPLERGEQDEARRVNSLAFNANNLSALMSSLSTLPKQPVATLLNAPDLEKGAVPWPASGRLLRDYRQSDAAGVVRDGVILAVPSLSLVTAPTDALVRFQGPFLDHGTMVILEPQDGHLFVIAGLSEAFVRAGQVIEIGTTIGLVGGDAPVDEVFLIESTASDSIFFEESLYIEVRKDGIAQNPREWFVPLVDQER